MLKIAHRINDPARLAAVPRECGIEIDLHGYRDRVVVHHDPFVDAVDLETWLDAYNHACVILNVKEEGIEARVRDIVLRRGIVDFFFLDLSFPAMMKMIASGERRVALRVSEYESPAGYLALRGRADWLWIDTFHGLPDLRAQHDALRDAGFRLCLVSPELHGRGTGEIAGMKSSLRQQGIVMDAVCTKHPELW